MSQWRSLPVQSASERHRPSINAQAWASVQRRVASPQSADERQATHARDGAKQNGVAGVAEQSAFEPHPSCVAGPQTPDRQASPGPQSRALAQAGWQHPFEQSPDAQAAPSVHCPRPLQTSAATASHLPETQVKPAPQSAL